MTNDAFEFLNTSTGVILGGTRGIVAASVQAGVNTRIVNEGTIAGNSGAILTGASNDTIFNSGALIGGVALGDGTDFLDSRLGATNGERIFGDLGDDTLDGGAGVDFLDGGAGHDSLIGGTNNDVLVGGWGDDTLQGGGGLDTLTGGAGDDLLNGGANPDVFVFAPNHGDDTIEGFTNGLDRMDVSGLGYVDFAALQADATISAFGAGSTLIEFDSGDSILLEGFALANLNAADFIF